MKIVDERKIVIMENEVDCGVVIYPHLEPDAPELKTFLAGCIRVRFDSAAPTIEIDAAFRRGMSVEAAEAWRAGLDKAIEIAKAGELAEGGEAQT